MTGEVRYAQSGDTHIAYRVVEGETDLDHTIVMVNGMFFPMDSLFEDPIAKRLVDGLAALGRLVMLDRRGVAMSDPITDWETPLRFQWADDVAAVVRAVTDEPVTVFSWESFGTGRTFAAAYPDLVERLVLWNPVGPLRRSDLDAIGDAVELNMEIQRGERSAAADRGDGRWSSDAQYRDWLDAAGRLGASPATARRISDHSFGAASLRTPAIDHDEVRCPVLVLVRPNEVAQAGLPADFNERAAHAVPDGRLVRFPPGAALIFGAPVDDILAEISEFVTGATRPLPAERVLTTLLFTDLVDSTAKAHSMGDEDWKRVLDRHDAVTRGVVGRGGGTIVKHTGDGVFATMPSVTAAIDAARAIRGRLADEALDVRAGIHVGEVDRRGDDLSGIAVNVASRVMDCADPGQILCSETASIIAGDDVAASAGRHVLKGVAGEWELFAVEEPA